MAFELEDVVNDPDLAEVYTVNRSTGVFAAGGWQSSTTVLQFWGVVTVADSKQLDMIPEADRVRGARMFFSQAPLYVTSELRKDGTSGTSDEIVYGNAKYRVLSVGQYPNRGGYYCAIAQRMQGS
jgi:hypothetical protein